MKTNSPNSLKSSRSGLTLIETAAALVILGTLLASMLMARGRYVTQWKKAELRIEALEAADKLLAQWWLDLRSFPRSDSGVIEGKEHLIWRTTPQASEQELFAQVVRLEVLDASLDADEPLARIDLLLPETRREEE